MTDYVYPQLGSITFGTRDTLAPGNAEKVVKGSQLDTEFNALVPSISSKLDISNPTFSGTLDGGNINGGTY